MAFESNQKRTDRGTRVIKASPHSIYQAMLNAESVAAWRPPTGMKAEIYAFEPREGGKYKMAFIYEDTAIAGKTADNADVFEGRFVELVPDKRVVEAVVFESDDPAFAGTMTIATTLTAVEGGTEVAIACTDVPYGIKEEDHQQGIRSTLENLAAFVEGA
ncbi:ATPase [Paraflavitalea soli]|uniref:ATPase n=1 Tax=Paraflavitalea soli TaxID=2315862 RepID=A0A3B7MX95_9BACT|nr:SRPBCC domain-containing protein [Paraflavitalea soli]AXY78607.1 ATPase [Paraflavitalea soli]